MPPAFTSTDADGTPLAERVHHAVQDAEALPALVRPVDGAIVRILLRQVIPAAAAPDAGDDRIERNTLGGPLSPKATGRIVLLKDRTNRFPLLIGDVGDWSRCLSIGIAGCVSVRIAVR